MIRPQPRERRSTLRFDKVFQVHLSSEEYGDVDAVCRNISRGGMLIETPAPLPLGSVLSVHFQIPGSTARITAVCEVKNQYAFNYAEGNDISCARGMGVRFLDFDRGEDELSSCLATFRVLH